MKQNQTILIIVGIAIVILLGNQLGFFSIGQFDYTKDVTFGEWNAVAHSTEDFGQITQNSIYTGSNGCTAYTYTTISVPDEGFSIDSNNWFTGCSGASVNMAPTYTDTYIQTTNLNFSTSDLKKLDILFNYENSVSCTDGDTSGQGLGKAYINLVSSSNTINIYAGPGVTSYHNPSQKESGQLTITKSYDNFLINRLGNTQIIEIPEGEYELQIYSQLRGCISGIGTSPIKISVSRLILEKQEPTIDLSTIEGILTKLDELELSLSQKASLINILELSLEEQEELISQLGLTIEEQAELIEALGGGIIIPDKFSINDTAFNIGDFEVTFLYILILIGGGLILIIIKK